LVEVPSGETLSRETVAEPPTASPDVNEPPAEQEPEFRESAERALAALEECILTCHACAAACDASDDAELAGCASTCRACAAVCEATVAVLRAAPWDRMEIVVAQSRSAYEATRSCASECSAHEHDFCQRCAAACARARDASKALLADVEDKIAPAAPASIRDVPRGDEEE
jgi:hypothetical protein